MIESPLLRETLAPFRPQLDALHRDALAPIRLDVFTIVKQAMGVVVKVERLRAELVATFGPRIGEQLDLLRGYGPALEIAHVTYLRLTGPATEVTRLSEKVVDVRESLELAARSLIKEGHLPKGSLASLQGAVGYRNQVNDTLLLVDLFRTHEAAIEGMTPIRRARVDEAESLAHELQRTIGEREQVGASGAITEERQRMYTLFVETYEDIRRAVVYVRWRAGDADELVPSLYASRGQRKGDSDEPDPTQPDAAQPASGAPTSGTPTTSTPVVTTTTPSSAPTATPSTPIPIGYPGSDPFVRST